jgi:hypothetical protein
MNVDSRSGGRDGLGSNGLFKLEKESARLHSSNALWMYFVSPKAPGQVPPLRTFSEHAGRQLLEVEPGALAAVGQPESESLSPGNWLLNSIGTNLRYVETRAY